MSMAYGRIRCLSNSHGLVPAHIQPGTSHLGTWAIFPLPQHMFLPECMGTPRLHSPSPVGGEWVGRAFPSFSLHCSLRGHLGGALGFHPLS